jgi:hypothetical protein
MPVPQPSNTYNAKMGCDNCGWIALYAVPKGYEIEDSDRDTEHYSCYHRHRSGAATTLYCMNCGTPYLKVFWQEDNVEPAKVSTNG